MSLISDADYLIYEMRKSMLESRDPLTERVIAIPQAYDSYYLMAVGARDAPQPSSVPADSVTTPLGIGLSRLRQHVYSNAAPNLEGPATDSSSTHGTTTATATAAPTTTTPTTAAAVVTRGEQSSHSHRRTNTVDTLDVPPASSTSPTSTTLTAPKRQASLSTSANHARRRSIDTPSSSNASRRRSHDLRPEDSSHDRRMAAIEILKKRLQQAKDTLQHDDPVNGTYVAGPSTDDAPEGSSQVSGQPRHSTQADSEQNSFDDEIAQNRSVGQSSQMLPLSTSSSARPALYSSTGNVESDSLPTLAENSLGTGIHEPIAEDDEDHPTAIESESPEEMDRSVAASPRDEPHPPAQSGAVPSTSVPPEPAEDPFAKRQVPRLAPIDKIAYRMSMRTGTTLKPASALTMMLLEQSRSNNPFGKDYSYYSGKGDSDPIQLLIYMPISDEPEIPLEVSVMKDATVEEVMGYALFEYWNEGRQPTIPEHLRDVVMWNMRIVEDGGVIDDDFPALERTRKISKFAFDSFALTEASPEQVKMNEGSRKPTMASNSQASISTSHSQQSLAATTVFLKVHLYSTIEVKQTTTMPVPSNIPLSEIYDQICRKRKYDPTKYVFKMADTKTDVPLDKTLDQLKVSELCILKKSGGGAGDVFLRPPDEKPDTDTQPRFIEPDEYSSMYKQYTVSHKAFVGRHERLLTIDGDYIHIMAAENKNFFDTMKTSSHHISSVVSCKPIKKQSASFRFLVQGSKGESKSYDFEATSQNEAAEICAKISFLIQMNKRESGLRLR
ncbi:stress-activated map kinase interacting protein 1-domain-containing protein [Gaertneriomyces semiglobifer]|nr:stress-activated map kinase interacting protein 1-domain-containing protein [Gaertneriomyces semiglobifer]